MNNNKIYDNDIFKEHIDFNKKSLDEEDLNLSPFVQFDQWFKDALKDKEINVNAMSLSTVNIKGFPSSRIVLLKNFSDEGFVFYTNYNSHKGKDIENNPNGCLLFFWQISERQIRIEGSIKKISSEDSDKYFDTRPIQSKINTWVSKQSQNTNKEELMERSKFFQDKYQNHPPRPAHWGGYILNPIYFEFWQGRTSRLHDRFSYIKNKSHTWDINRLFP
ncbi:Pyridoxine/pyridoxamine 5'-phosphate oxidase [Candidatus Kinetoplastibacterium sorsogonicusi]|uniref:Pyridoxine/pyridoxamine 5'-phosphate oxidase n=1 Tax=Candidatus Kinetoplastidibacterium kentomonadis TaxID=1576550 RepID=A0A3Q8ERU9_9PROT|nr:pyridoxamine 5'-phosphate oxidase [Candidatus Kinetoplastibacterium sorsogonicusi]AWD32640.1 Pyridoxine/pyridoxamine 5'-phosphate oxidase [Candidatus Kinetoplastibacterium sorsogonicusi]